MVALEMWHKFIIFTIISLFSFDQGVFYESLILFKGVIQKYAHDNLVLSAPKNVTLGACFWIVSFVGNFRCKVCACRLKTDKFSYRLGV